MAKEKIPRYRSPAFKIILNDPSNQTPSPTVPTRVQLLRTGSFTDDRYGTFDIKPEHLLAMKKNFDEKVRGIDIAIDYFHESDKLAAGWILGLELEEKPDGSVCLYANPVKWTSSASPKLADGELRYLSADFMFNYKDNETLKEYGPVLLGAGLTNRPVIKEMDPIIVLKEGKGNEMDHAAKFKELEEKMAEYDEKINTLKKAMDAKGDDDGDEGSDDDEDGEDGKKAGEGKSKGKSAKLDPEAMQAEMDEMKKKLAGYENTAKCAEQTNKFNKLLSEGRAVEAQREAFLAGDMVKFSELNYKIKLSNVGHGLEVDSEGLDSQSATPNQDKVIELAQKLVDDKKASDLGNAISKVLSDKKNVKLAEGYRKETSRD